MSSAAEIEIIVQNLHHTAYRHFKRTTDCLSQNSAPITTSTVRDKLLRLDIFHLQSKDTCTQIDIAKTTKSFVSRHTPDAFPRPATTAAAGGGLGGGGWAARRLRCRAGLRRIVRQRDAAPLRRAAAGLGQVDSARPQQALHGERSWARIPL